MMIAAMLALVVVVGVAPAQADSNDFFDRFGDNDNPNEFFDRFDDNDNHNDFFDHFFANGNFQNGASFVQVGSESGDFEPGGIEVTFEPQQGVQCSNTIQQSSAASS